MDKVKKEFKRKTSWYVINIKARKNQCCSHYVEIFNRIIKDDPLIQMEKRSDRYISIFSSQSYFGAKSDNLPLWIRINLVAYTMIDPTAFYNRKSKKDIQMQWDEDVVANKKDAQIIFIPSVHKVVIKKNSSITLNYILQYLSGALNRTEQNGFDVDVVKDRDTIDRILSAEKLLSLNAHISFSNPGSYTSDFIKLFDVKLNESNISSAEISLQGSEEEPINCTEDGLVTAVVNLSEMNGSVEAVVQNGTANTREVINTADHPLILQMPQKKDDDCQDIYNKLMQLYNYNNYE